MPSTDSILHATALMYASISGGHSLRSMTLPQEVSRSLYTAGILLMNMQQNGSQMVPYPSPQGLRQSHQTIRVRYWVKSTTLHHAVRTWPREASRKCKIARPQSRRRPFLLCSMISVHERSLSYSLLSAFTLFFYHPSRTTCKYRYRQQECLFYHDNSRNYEINDTN